MIQNMGKETENEERNLGRGRTSEEGEEEGVVWRARGKERVLQG